MLLPSASNVLLGQSTFAVVADVVYNYRKWKIDVTRALAAEQSFFGNNLGLIVNGTVSLRSVSRCFGFTIICITHRAAVGWVSWKGSESCEVGHTSMFARSKAPRSSTFLRRAPKQHCAIKIECRSSLSHSVHDLRHFLFLSRDVRSA